MTHFFRKIRKQLANDNRFLKYSRYAVGEIVLVVIGILIAIQINNWNEKRKERTKEQYYLKSIKTSIDLSQAELKRVIDRAKKTYSSADTLFILLSLNKHQQLNGSFLDSLLHSSRDYSQVSLTDGGIKEILNTGAIDIIQDERIRVFLASWEERIHKIRKYEAHAEYYAKNYQEYLMHYLDHSRYELGQSSAIIPEKKQQLLRDPKLRTYLDNIYIIHKGMYEQYLKEKESLDALGNLVYKNIKQ